MHEIRNCISAEMAAGIKEGMCAVFHCIYVCVCVYCIQSECVSNCTAQRALTLKVLNL